MPAFIKNYFQNITSFDEAKLYALSYQILPRGNLSLKQTKYTKTYNRAQLGSQKSERDIEREEAERDAEIVIAIPFFFSFLLLISGIK